MIEESARAWVADRFGGAAVDRLETFAAMVRAETQRQNLVAASTLQTIWSRHLADSAQLVPLAPATGAWFDIGTGGGFPGLVVALLRPEPITLIEPRKLRAAFLASCIEALGLPQAHVTAAPVERVTGTAAVISARAVAGVEKLLHAALHCATKTTRWLLPRGRWGPDELAEVRQRWAGVFHVEQSIVNPASAILIIEGAHARGARS